MYLVHVAVESECISSLFQSFTHCKFHLLSYEHGIFSEWVVAFPCIKYMLLLKVNVFLLFSNLLPKFHLLSYEHGIFSGWVVAFPCIKYMLLLKVNVFLLFSNLLPKFHLSSHEHGIFSEWVVAFPRIKYMLLLKVNVFLLFSNLLPIANSTCCLMNMVFSASELLPSHVLSTCCCWKWMYFFSFPIFYPLQIPLAVLWTWYFQRVSCCLPMY